MMALIPCPECNENISDKSEICIHCGYPLKKQELNQSNTYSVVLNNYGANRLETIKCVRIITGLDLKPTMNIVDNVPSVIACNVSLNEADKIKQMLDSVGSNVTIKKYDDSDSLMNNPQLNTLHCPHCGSTSVTTGQRGFSLFSGFLGSNKTVNRCGSCGWTWQPKR